MTKWMLALVLAVTEFGLLTRVPAQQKFPLPHKPRVLSAAEFSARPLDVGSDNFIHLEAAKVRAKFDHGIELDGSGLVVAVVDTGINAAHKAFDGALIPGRNLTGDGLPEDTIDTNGHGSHVAGIICGRGIPNEANFPRGVATAARVLPLKVFGDGHYSRICDALEWLITERHSIRTNHGATLSVVNMSLGSQENLGQADPTCADCERMRLLITELRELKIAVVVSAGNRYGTFTHNGPAEGMSFPAIIPDTISVGALYDTDFNPAPIIDFGDARVAFTRAGHCAVFTQRLSAVTGGDFQTDIFAPGYRVLSAACAPHVVKAAEADGTSQAAPVVSGVTLLMQQFYLKKTGRLPDIDLIEQCLKAGTEFTDVEIPNMDSVPASCQEFVALDVFKALLEMENALASN